MDPPEHSIKFKIVKGDNISNASDSRYPEYRETYYKNNAIEEGNILPVILGIQTPD